MRTHKRSSTSTTTTSTWSAPSTLAPAQTSSLHVLVLLALPLCLSLGLWRVNRSRLEGKVDNVGARLHRSRRRALGAILERHFFRHPLDRRLRRRHRSHECADPNDMLSDLCAFDFPPPILRPHERVAAGLIGLAHRRRAALRWRKDDFSTGQWLASKGYFACDLPGHVSWPAATAQCGQDDTCHEEDRSARLQSANCRVHRPLA